MILHLRNAPVHLDLRGHIVKTASKDTLLCYLGNSDLKAILAYSEMSLLKCVDFTLKKHYSKEMEMRQLL